LLTIPTGGAPAGPRPVFRTGYSKSVALIKPPGKSTGGSNVRIDRGERYAQDIVISSRLATKALGRRPGSWVLLGIRGSAGLHLVCSFRPGALVGHRLDLSARWYQCRSYLAAVGPRWGRPCGELAVQLGSATKFKTKSQKCGPAVASSPTIVAARRSLCRNGGVPWASPIGPLARSVACRRAVWWRQFSKCRICRFQIRQFFLVGRWSGPARFGCCSRLDRARPLSWNVGGGSVERGRERLDRRPGGLKTAL